MRLSFRFINLQNCLLNLVEPRGCFSYKFDYNAGEGPRGRPVNSCFRCGRPPAFATGGHRIESHQTRASHGGLKARTVRDGR